MPSPLHLFDAFGIELEYMLVDQVTLEIFPAVDQIFHDASGHFVSDFEDGPITWSNELVRHVMEVKVTQPVASLKDLTGLFNGSIKKINTFAEKHAALLLPTAMHPWMDPARETHLWPHECAEVYQTFHRVFDCYRHGWANLQSVHLNLPFYGDQEFARLHAAIRLVLPLIPAIAASSPIMDGKPTGVMDNRLDVYCHNSRLVTQIAGEIIPEPVYSEAEYREHIFEPMFKAISPYDPDGTLQDEFLNARGAIARFDRSAIEIRLIDVQECPLADLAVVQAVIHAIRALVEERHCSWKEQSGWTSSRLRQILSGTIDQAEKSLITDSEYLRIWGIEDTQASSASEIWKHITQNMSFDTPALGVAFQHILSRGTLARRMLHNLTAEPDKNSLLGLYMKLARCLSSGQQLLDG